MPPALPGGGPPVPPRVWARPRWLLGVPGRRRLHLRRYQVLPHRGWSAGGRYPTRRAPRLRRRGAAAPDRPAGAAILEPGDGARRTPGDGL